ncbi:helix-turn-helix domain-containing protein [Paenibacillus sp. HB172176]|uniref:AraC family transcriptional regulator n=1 Tax=Paenibacillus sp. HB172176 TaxID=2493690 RepID=UPI001438FBE3|nr:helix-turn-helix domain-containing protein [Paenibacillus sp. HB172176]
MTFVPVNKKLTDYAFISPEFPFHISENNIVQSFPLHRHDFLECSLVIEGRGHEIVNGSKHELRPGTFTLLLPYQVHEIIADRDAPITLYNCMFDMVFLFDMARAEPALERMLYASSELSPSLQLDGEDYASIRALMKGMMVEAAANQAWREVLLKLKLVELLILFDRMRSSLSVVPSRYQELAEAGTGQGREAAGGLGSEAGESGKASKENKEGVERTASGSDNMGMGSRADKNGKTGMAASTSQATIWHVIQYVHTHYREELRLSSLARKFGFNASHLSELISRHVGSSFTHFLHEVRIRQACGLLLSTDLKVVDVGVEVGFGSFPSFLRVFKELKGASPSEYRKQNLKN